MMLLKTLLTTSLLVSSTTTSTLTRAAATTTTPPCAWVGSQPLWMAPKSCRRRRRRCRRRPFGDQSLLLLSSLSLSNDDNDDDTNNDNEHDLPPMAAQSWQQFASAKTIHQSSPAPKRRFDSIDPVPTTSPFSSFSSSSSTSTTFTTTTASFFPGGYVDLEDFVQQREREKKQQQPEEGSSNSFQIPSVTETFSSKETLRFQEEEDDDSDSIYLDTDTYLATSMQMGTTLALDDDDYETFDADNDGTILMEEDDSSPWKFKKRRGTTTYHRRSQDMIQNLILQQIEGLEQYQKQQKQKLPANQQQENQTGQSVTNDSSEPTANVLRALGSRQDNNDDTAATTNDEQEKVPDRSPENLDNAETLHQQVFENEQGFLNQSQLFRESLTDPSKSAQAAVYRRQHFSDKDNDENALGTLETDDTSTRLYQKQAKALRELQTQMKEFEDQFQKDNEQQQQWPRCDSCQCILSSEEIAAQKAMQRPEALCQVCHAEKYLITRQPREDEPSPRVRPQRFSSSFYYPTLSSSPPSKFPLKRSPTTFTPSATREMPMDAGKATRNEGTSRRTTVSTQNSTRSVPPISRGSSSHSSAEAPSSPRSVPTKWRTSKAILNRRVDGKRGRPAGTFIDTDHNGLNPTGPKSQSTKSRSPPTSLQRKEDDSSKKSDSETPYFDRTKHESGAS